MWAKILVRPAVNALFSHVHYLTEARRVETAETRTFDL
jgi:hypothetical protein